MVAGNEMNNERQCPRRAVLRYRQAGRHRGPNGGEA